MMRGLTFLGLVMAALTVTLEKFLVLAVREVHNLFIGLVDIDGDLLRALVLLSGFCKAAQAN